MKIRIEALLAVATAAGAAFAQAPASDTVKLVVEKGAVFDLGGVSYDFVAKPDGSYADGKGAAMGSYRTDGGKLCVLPKSYPQEACFDLPAGKKSGDSFEAAGPQGVAKVTIR